MNCAFLELIAETPQCSASSEQTIHYKNQIFRKLKHLKKHHSDFYEKLSSPDFSIPSTPSRKIKNMVPSAELAQAFLTQSFTPSVPAQELSSPLAVIDPSALPLMPEPLTSSPVASPPLSIFIAFSSPALEQFLAMELHIRQEITSDNLKREASFLSAAIESAIKSPLDERSGRGPHIF